MQIKLITYMCANISGCSSKYLATAMASVLLPEPYQIKNAVRELLYTEVYYKVMRARE